MKRVVVLMLRLNSTRNAVLAGTTLVCATLGAAELERGSARAEVTRPASFPHRIWAANDFETRAPDYAWFGEGDSNNIPRYPGNQTALRGSLPAGGGRFTTGMNPVPGPRMGRENFLYLRYFLTGTTEAVFQYFSLTSEDNNHIKVSGLTQKNWSELTLNFTRDGRRNDGTAGIPFKEGERMDDLKISPGEMGEKDDVNLIIDDAILFANDPKLPPEPEPFPRRVIHLAAFDTGPKEKYWPGDFEIIDDDNNRESLGLAGGTSSASPRKKLPPDSYWRAARAVPRKDGQGKLVSLPINPVKPVGAQTKLRFRYHLTGITTMTVQIFDATVMDNRHIELRDLKTGSWQTVYLDFTRDSRRNDGSKDRFEAGNLVDDILFFVGKDAAEPIQLLVDEVILFDAY